MFVFNTPPPFFIFQNTYLFILNCNILVVALHYKAEPQLLQQRATLIMKKLASTLAAIISLTSCHQPTVINVKSLHSGNIVRAVVKYGTQMPVVGDTITLHDAAITDVAAWELNQHRMANDTAICYPDVRDTDNNICFTYINGVVVK